MRRKRLVAALIVGAGVLTVTAGVVSLLTPDGNLVIALVPALAAGLVSALATLRGRRDKSQ